MAKYKLTREMDIHGVTYNYGDIVELDDINGIPFNSSLVMVDSVADNSATIPSVQSNYSELSAMKLKDLKELGLKYGVKNTIRKELTDGIIKAKMAKKEL